ncbi:septum formation family protein [Gordonia sp. CPCC 206044]|uniref:septum formation family protein n=1 Tax=Gordonia sp. CPCC 206044 TaxID=3140793 RepID=UPI003AF3E19B
MNADDTTPDDGDAENAGGLTPSDGSDDETVGAQPGGATDDADGATPPSDGTEPDAAEPGDAEPQVTDDATPEETTTDLWVPAPDLPGEQPSADDTDTQQFDRIEDAPTQAYSAAPAGGVPDDDVPEGPAEGSESRVHSILAHPVRVVLAAVVIGAVVAGAVALAIGVFNDSGSVGGTDIGENERLAENAFTKSVTGDCLDWAAGNPGDPNKVTCDQKHRFEVAGPLDTAVLPGSEFGESAVWPGPERFGAIRDEQCAVIVDQYLDGRLDPQGRFSVGMMYPSQAQWEKGARELRCGLQQTGKDGEADQFTGRVADQDQSFHWDPGTCIGIDPATKKPTGMPVNCTEAHAFQTTGTVDLSHKFGDRLSGKPWPGVAAQNNYLQSICPVQADRFVGGKQKLDATTLNVQWSVLSEPSWLAGSRTAVCYLGLPDGGGFATLVGDARSTLLINGKLPVPPPAAPPGRALPTPVPLPPGVVPNPQEEPAPAG